jgi:acetolactate synthase-1/2/3 large subunit
MRTFGLYASAVSRGRALLHQDGYQRRPAGDVPDALLDDVLDAMYRKPSGAVDGLGLALLHAADLNKYAGELAQALGATRDAAAAAAERLRQRAAPDELLLTGAEASVVMLGRAGVEIVFAYPGTSELALCDAVARAPGIRLINSRGDKEAAFMSAGASMLAPGQGAAILHAARGLTNAAGGVADARRNEWSSLVIVGLPSTSTAKYLPPHQEPRLLEGIGLFAKAWYELTREDHGAFAAIFAAALGDTMRRPYGPVLLGLPQDIAQDAWVPYPACLAARSLTWQRLAADAVEAVPAAADVVRAAARIVVIADDYFLRYADAAQILAAFCAKTGALVLQVKYQRGAMLFDRLSQREVPAYAGWLDPSDAGQRNLLNRADLLITLEDRNMYRRVVGVLPPCRKIAITSDAGKVRKNEYLSGDDVLLEGDVATLLRAISDQLNGARATWADERSLRLRPPAVRGEVASPPVRLLHASIGNAFANALRTVDEPVLIDDAQMFGGLLAQAHDAFPAALRIFGDHGGFVGGGIAYATGLALAESGVSVVCSLGDQGFGNGCQGLVTAAEQRAPVTFVVCNNGRSVSLLKQARAANERLFDDGAEPFLDNSAVEPAVLAAAMGLYVDRIDFTDLAEDAIARAAARLEGALAKAFAARGPHLIELRLPASDDVWAGIWLAAGFDETAGARAQGAAAAGVVTTEPAEGSVSS